MHPQLVHQGYADPVASEVLGAEELEIYGYVGKETAIFKTGATARDIANSVNAIERVKQAFMLPLLLTLG